jgi:hypothetical protein
MSDASLGDQRRPDAAPLVAICTPSYRRRALLLQLIASLKHLRFSQGRAPRLQLILVDNSPDHDLADLAQLLSDLTPLPAQLAHEPKPGLSAARNRLLALAQAAGADFIAFVDDDERPAPDWLDKLMQTQERENADFVTGVVIGELPAGAPAWMKAGRFFDHLPGPTYRGVSGGHTATTLVRVAAIEAAGARFEEAFALTGGEDTMFFTRLEAAGAHPARATDAFVYETVPAERARLSWLLRRWTRTGSSEARLELVRRQGLLTRLYCIAGGLLRLVVGALAAAAMSPMALAGRAHLSIARLKTAARGLGFIRGGLGRDVAEYARR